MFHMPAQLSTPERKGRIWAKVPHENRHFKIPIVYFSYIKERLFVVKGGLVVSSAKKTGKSNKNKLM